jgi:alkylation response protein AidB-like acyl-CoA dehydrogenase
VYQWSDEQLMIRDAVRQFVEAEIAPKREELEHGDLPPYDILRKLFATFGMDAMAQPRAVQGPASEREEDRRARGRSEPGPVVTRPRISWGR